MKDVSMMPVVTMSRIGVYPDGSPVVYDPEKAAAKRAEIAAKIAEQCRAEGRKPPMFIHFAPELENNGRMDRAGYRPDGSKIPEYFKNPLERNPEVDELNLNFKEYNDPMLAASMKLPPKVTDAATDVIVDIIKKYGVEAAVFLITTGWNAIFSGGRNDSVNEEIPVNNLHKAMMENDINPEIYETNSGIPDELKGFEMSA